MPGGHDPSALAALDFRVFYCAGEVVRTHGDPYHLEPLRSCEKRVAPTPGQTWEVTPAPFPGYVLAVFVPLSRLPYHLAHSIWVGLMVGASALATFLLADLLAWPVLAVAFILLPTATLLNLYLGEPTPLAIGALVSAAFLASLGRFRTCALALGVAMIEPHIALPALAALAIAVPRARTTVVAIVAGLGALSLTAIGIAHNVEYFQEALPFQARAEVFATDQYSLTHLLALVHVKPSLAITLGGISYFLSAALGVILALRHRGTPLGEARFILIPGAVGLLGGSFVHDAQIASALPAVLLLTMTAKRPALGVIALVALTFSFMAIGSKDGLAFAVLAAAAAGIWGVRTIGFSRIRAGFLSAAAMLILVLTISRMQNQAPNQGPTTPPVLSESQREQPSSTAGLTWGEQILENPSMSKETAADLARKLPAWIGLGLLIALARRLPIDASSERNIRDRYSVEYETAPAKSPTPQGVPHDG